MSPKDLFPFVTILIVSQEGFVFSFSLFKEEFSGNYLVSLKSGYLYSRDSLLPPVETLLFTGHVFVIESLFSFCSVVDTRWFVSYVCVRIVK